MRTQGTGSQIKDEAITRDLVDTTTSGSAVIRKLIAGTGLEISSTGVDEGTGDVTINVANVGGTIGQLVEARSGVLGPAFLVCDGSVKEVADYPDLATLFPTAVFEPSTGTLLGSTQNWADVAWNGTLFCAINPINNTAATSPDGVTWAQKTLPASANPWSALGANGSVFCAIVSGGNLCATSTDGNTWSSGTMPVNSGWSDVAWNGSVFCAVSSSNGTVAATSANGTSWTARTLPVTQQWRSIAWNGTVFCAISGTAAGSNVAATSPDGVTWTQRTLPASLLWVDIVWDGTVFCAVANGTSGTGTTIAATSPDGITWTQRTLPASATWATVCGNANLLWAIASNSKITAFSRDHGATWTQYNITTATAWGPNVGAIANSTTFCAVTDSATAQVIRGVEDTSKFYLPNIYRRAAYYPVYIQAL